MGRPIEANREKEFGTKSMINNALTVNFPIDLYQELEKKSKELGITKGQLIRNTLKKALF